MKKTGQQAHETQEVTKQNSAVTSNHRIHRIEYTSFQSKDNSKINTSSLRNKRETVEKAVVKSNGLKNGGSFHYDISDSLKSGISDNGDGISSGDISVSEQTEVSVSAVTNVSLCSGSPNGSSDGKLGAENVGSGGRRPKSCPVLHHSAPADEEKAKDRLVKSHSHIEQLQQNLATKLSTATVAAFIQEYSPALGRRSHSNVGGSSLIDGNPNGKGGCSSHNVADPFATSRNQDNIRNNRKIPYPKSSVGKGDSLGSVLKRKKFVFLNGFFDHSVIKHHRKHTDSRKNYGRTPDETEGSRQLDVNSPTQLVENGLTRLEGKKGNRDRDSGRPSADAISPNCGKTDVNSNKVVCSDTFEIDTEAADKGRNTSPCNSPGHGDNRCGASQQHTCNTLEPAVPTSPPKPARVSWTTALIQKLTEEEARKKTKSQTKVQKSRRLVRFPQKKPPKVVNENKPKPSEGFKKRRESAPLSQPTTEIPTKQSDSERSSIKKNTKENPSGVILDDKCKDAYANLVSQLLVSTNEEDSQQASELKGEDFVLKQRELEEIRAAIAREECASIISDDDSVILAPITASTESIEAGRRKEPKPSGIRRLLPQGLFAQKHRHVDRRDEGAAHEPLLNRVDPSRVYPATTTARPVLETAFLSDSNSKLPVRSGVRQQQRSQSSSPAPRHKQPSPRTRRHQDRDQISIQENEQNSSRISQQTRSKSLSPARDRSSSAASRTSKRTIPDTSLVLEERLQHIRRELSSPSGRDVTRPSSATPPDYPNRVPQRHDSLPLPSNKTIHQEQIYHNTGRAYSSVPSNAYYHSPPSRRRQQNKDRENDHKADDYRRKASGGSSASSSSSTIVAETPPVSALSWNPLLRNLENHAISGSPDIRKLQQHRHPRHANKDSGLYGEIRNSVDRDSSALIFHSTDSQDNYSRSNSGVSRKPQGLLQVHHDTAVLQQRSPISVPSGRLSAPPVPSYYIEDYPGRRVRSPEPHRSRQEYEYDQSSRRSLSQPPRLRQSDQKSSPRPSFRPVNPTEKGLSLPVAAQLQIILSPQSRPRQDDNGNTRETQTARSYIQLQHQQLEKNPRNSSHDRQYKLSRQQIEALYWETQKLREGLSSLSQNMSPHAPRLGVRYHSTASLPQQAFSAYRSSSRSEQSSPMLYQPEAVPGQPFRTQSVQNVGGGYGSPIVRPQPVYNIVQQYQPVRQARTSHDATPRAPRARSASPGPNSNRHLSSRSLSLPRSIPASMMLENQHYKASESVVSNFARGVPHRNTIGPIKISSHFPHSPQIRQQSTPTIYEETQQQVGDDVRYEHATEVDGRSGNKINNKTQNYVNTVMNRNPTTGDGNGCNKSGSGKRSKKSSSQQLVSPQPYYPPIFKRGSLVSTSTCLVDGVDSSMSPKRVSFSGYDEPLYWPTRNGPAPEPPTRQRKVQSTNPDPFLRSEGYGTYANVPQAPNRPLPPEPHDVNGATYGTISRKSRDSKSPASGFPVSPQRWQQLSESESGSEAGEVQRILQQGSHGRGTYFRFPVTEEEWGADGKSRGPPGTDQSVSNVGRDEEVRRGGGGGGRSGRRDEPRRHTLSGDHHHHQQGSALARSMDLEMSSKSQRRKSPLPRGYPPPSSAMLFDDDPGIMSEVETSSTGFRRGGKQRSSLPVVRTPSKTLERPLGLVFLQYRNETKRALLPNEITSIDTVKALFVRSFPKQLTMEYLDSPHVKIYIHDSSKDMFYELEDLRSHLRDIRDRSVLRLFESTDMNGGVLPGAGVGVMAPPIWDQDQTYWSEPEFDSEYQHQHIHKTKASSKSGSSGGGPPQAPYYMTHSYPPGGTQGAPGASATLPRGGPLLRAYSPAVAPSVPADRIKSLPQTDRLHSESGYMSSPERGGPRAYPAAAYPPGGPGYEDPYYSQYASRSGSITPVIDEEARIRVEHMERQLANLTGLVQKALTQTPPTPREYLQVPPPASARDANYRNDDSYLRTDTKPPKLGKERTERDRHKPAPPPKPVSLSPGQYEGRHVYRDLQLTPEMYNQLRGLQKKAKDLRQEVRNLRRMSQAQAHSVRETIRDTFMKIRAMLLIGGEEAWAISGDADKVRLNREEDTYKQEMLRLEKDLTELESTVEELRGNVINRKTRVNMSDVENMALILSKSSKTVADLKVRFPSLQEGMKGLLASEMEKVVREEKFLKEEPERLESALRRCKKLTGTLVTLKRLASVQEQRLPPSTTPESRLSPTVGLGGDSDTPITPPAHGKPSAIPARSVMAPTIGGDGSVSRQRPENALDALLDELQTFARPPFRAGSGHNPIMADIGRKGSIDSAHPHAPSLPSSTGTSSLRRLHSYPSSSDGGGNSPPTVALARLQVSGSSGADAPKSPATSPKPPVPERNSELLSHLAGRRIPPPPPPRTSSRSPLASPTSPSLPPRGQHPPSQPQMGVGGGTLLRRGGPGRSSLREPLRGTPGISVSSSTATAKQEDPNQLQPGFNPLSASNSSSCESINSQEGLQQSKAVSTSSNTGNKARQEILEQRHQELLRKQRALQEQYARLQQLQRSGGGGLAVVPPPDLILKKTGSESNLLAKMGLGHGLSAAAPISGSLTHLAAVAASANPQPIMAQQPQKQVAVSTAPATMTTNAQPTTTTNKIYETDIL